MHSTQYGKCFTSDGDISSYLKVSGTFDYFGPRSYSDYPYLTEQQRMHRDILRTVMHRYGFKGISTEWWHFILIDEPYSNLYFNFPVKRM